MPMTAQGRGVLEKAFATFSASSGSVLQPVKTDITTFCFCANFSVQVSLQPGPSWFGNCTTTQTLLPASFSA
jgi:hypothetical protein